MKTIPPGPGGVSLAQLAGPIAPEPDWPLAPSPAADATGSA